MKLNTVENVIERSVDLVDEANFTIALTAKAIEVLSSQIYKDAHQAIVRELGTNAADSHIEAGKRDVPFDVTIPNNMMPEFVIRDYGTGMSYQKVMTMYRTYFGSDKTNSNEVTGCLGLGSKSPLAYADQFNVTSWYEGEKSVYTVYKNERGLPAINRIHHELSEEPTGVEVRISVSPRDFHIFQNKAVDVYRWFTPKPNLHGFCFNGWTKDEFSLTSDTWALRRDNQQRMTIVMGNVAYYVEKNDLFPVRAKLSGKEHVLCDCGPILYVGIGDVDIAASRESLKFDGPKTYPTIKRLLGVMAAEIVKRVADEIEAAESHWDARKVLFKHQVGVLGSLIPMKATWRGIDVDVKIKVQDTHERIFPHVVRYYPRRAKFGMRTISTVHVCDIDCTNGAEIFIADSKNHISRIGYHLRQKMGFDVCVYLLSEGVLPDVKEDPNSTALDCDGQPKKPKVPPTLFKIADFIKDSHIEGMIRYTSELKDPPKNSIGFRNKSSQILSPHGHNPSGSHWKENTVDFNKGGIYVEVKGNYWSAGKVKERKASDLYDFMPMIPALDIVGVRVRTLNEFAESDNWVRLDDWVIDKYANDQSIRDEATKAALYRWLNADSTVNLCSELSTFNIQLSDGLFSRLCNLLADYKKSNDSSTKAQIYKLAIPFMNTPPLELDGDLVRIKKMYREFAVTYPLLTRLNDLLNDGAYQAIIEYVDLIDGEAAVKTKKIHKGAAVCV